MPNFYSININGFRRSDGVLLYDWNPVVINQIIEVDTSGTGAASAWTRTAQQGDVFFIFCKRGEGCESSENGPLPISLKTRGIYAIAKSVSNPYPYRTGRTAIRVRIIALLENHVSQLEININPITYWATPYRGNRNDAIQRHPDETNERFAPHPQQGLEFVKMILAKNSGLRNTLINEWPYFKNKV